MFSGFRFRNRNAYPDQTMRGKRPNENDNSHHDEIEEPPEKMGRLELDDSHDESFVCPSPDLENFVRKYTAFKECVLTDNPVPGNVDKPSAVNIYINEMIKETVSGNRTLGIDGFLINIQEAISNVLEPMTKLWVLPVKQRDELLAVEVSEDKAAWKAEFDKMDAISKTLDSVVSLLGQTSQRTSYYRRHLILESLKSDHKKTKTMLNDWQSALADNTSKDLFGNKFEEEICKSSKTKTKSKDVFKDIASSNQPFCGGLFASRGSRGHGNRGFSFRFKGLNFTSGKKFVSTTSHKLPSSSRHSPGSPTSEVFVPRGSSVPVPTGRKKKLSSNQAVLNMILGYKVLFSKVLRQNKYPRQVPMFSEKSLLVDTQIQTLLEKEQIKMIDSSQDKYLSPSF